MDYNVNPMAFMSGIFPVPDVLVDENIRLASVVQLKVILYILRHSKEKITKEGLEKAVFKKLEEADINTDKDTDVNVGADINGDVDTGVDTDVIADTDTNTNISASIEMPTDVEKIIEIIEKTTKTINSDTEDSVLNDGFGYEKENKIDEIIIPKAPDTSIVK